MKKRKIYGLLLLVMLLVMSAMPVQAAKVNSPLANCTITLYSSKDYDCDGKKANKYLLGYVYGSKVTNVKSSNTSVLTVHASGSAFNGQTWTNFSGVAKKAGTATVSYKMGGKTYKVKITVKKYVNPVSSIKIGKTTLSKSKFAKSSNVTLKYSKYANKKNTVVIRLASGWSFGKSSKSGFISCKQGGTWTDVQVSAKGTTLTIKGGKGYTINLEAYNKKTRQSEDINIFFK